MDSERFDGLVRSFGQVRSRRQTLRGLAGAGALVALLAATPVAADKTGKPNKAPKNPGKGQPGNSPPGSGQNGGGLLGSAGPSSDCAVMCVCHDQCPEGQDCFGECFDAFSAYCEDVCASDLSCFRDCADQQESACPGPCQPDDNCPQPSIDSTYAETCGDSADLGEFVPGSNLLNTCTADGTTLSGACADHTGDPRDAEIIVNSCQPQDYVISNCDGTLRCGDC